jgi:hypothetical protein
MVGKPFALLGVNTNGYTPDKLRQVMDKENLPWRSFADPRDAKDKDATSRGPITESWSLEGTPTLYLLDHRGVIRYHWLGSPGEKALGAALARLLKEVERDGKGESR